MGAGLLCMLLGLPGLRAQFTVLELYTYDGCHNCAQASGNIDSLLRSRTEGLVLLSFHVDFDEHDGFSDSLSSPYFMARQQQYLQAGISEAIFTPQAIVNGRSVFSASNKARLFRETTRDTLPALRMDTLVKRSEAGLQELQIRCTLPDGLPKAVLNIALCTDVDALRPQQGENKDKLLKSYRTVRGFVTLDPSKSTSRVFSIPKERAGEKHWLVAFLQRVDNGAIVAAGQMPVAP